MDQIIRLPSGKFRIRPYERSDEEAVIRLWELVFENQLPKRHWHWKYAANPYGTRIMLGTSLTDEPLVFYGGIPFQANLTGTEVEIIQLMDIMSHPDYRKTGLFVKTVEAFIDYYGGDEKAALFYGFPGQYHFQIGKKYLAYDELSGGARFLRAAPQNLFGGHFTAGELVRIHESTSAFDQIWLKNSRHYPFAVIRNAQFIKWRFCEHPGNDYEIYGYRTESDRQLVGYVILLMQKKKVVMVDVLMPPVAGMIQDLMAKIARIMEKKGIQVMETWLPANHFLGQALESAGFATAPEPLGFVPTGRSFASFLPFGWAADKMYYTMADADLF